jgi:ABC-type uncharacterized transport system ATPase subunit
VNPIELRGVRKSYREKVVLEGASLSVPRGSVTGLLGKNGAGKSTLIKCALGLHRIDEGSAEIFGEPTWTLSAGAKARLAYVPQEVSLLPHHADQATGEIHVGVLSAVESGSGGEADAGMGAGLGRRWWGRCRRGSSRSWR